MPGLPALPFLGLRHFLAVIKSTSCLPIISCLLPDLLACLACLASLHACLAFPGPSTFPSYDQVHKLACLVFPGPSTFPSPDQVHNGCPSFFPGSRTLLRPVEGLFVQPIIWKNCWPTSQCHCLAPFPTFLPTHNLPRVRRTAVQLFHITAWATFTAFLSIRAFPQTTDRSRLQKCFSNILQRD